jgi:predicted nuclease of predicted toxin-antitoxin system
MLEFLIDESVPFSAAAVLGEHGYTTHRVSDVGLRGAPDAAIFGRAQEEGWIVITRDLGFGNLLEYPLGTHAGIIVLRVPSTFTAHQIRDTRHVFIGGVEPEMLRNALAIVEPSRYRIRRPEQS